MDGLGKAERLFIQRKHLWSVPVNIPAGTLLLGSLMAFAWRWSYFASGAKQPADLVHEDHSCEAIVAFVPGVEFPRRCFVQIFPEEALALLHLMVHN